MHSEAITLDVAKRLMVDWINLRVGEGGLTTIDATILNNGVAYDLTGTSVLFMAYDPDLKVIYENARIVDAKAGKVSYTVSKSLTNMAGKIRQAYFRINTSNDQITTQNIPILVEANVDLNDEQAGEYTSQFEQLLQQVQELIETTNTALTDTRTATKNANDAADAANTANANYSKAEANRVASEGQRSLNETARQDAESKRKADEDSRIAAEQARDSAEQARAAAETSRAEEWEQIKEEAETATTNAQDAADAANEAAQRVDETITEAVDATNQATDRANKAAANVEAATKLANEAAGEATTAASLANATNERAQQAIEDINDALDEYNTILGTEISYAIGTSSTMPPTDGWTAAQQAVPKGMYAWERTVTHYKKGNPTTAYNVAYQGMDGRDGIGVETSSLFWLWGDTEGNLWATYSDENNPPQFSYDGESGNVYLNV